MNDDWVRWRERDKRILRGICSKLDIDQDVSSLGLGNAGKFSNLFPDTNVLVVRGSGFERPALPDGSYMYCAFDQHSREVVELTPRNSALKQLLHRNWDVLPQLSPVSLADFILTIQTVGTVYHEVLTDLSDLDKEGRRDEGFVLNDRATRLGTEMELSTWLDSSADELVIHALTLLGWMHEKQNLGVTDISVLRDGNVVTGKRQTVCEPVFLEIPWIWY